MPVGAVGCVSELGVETHNRGKNLGEKKDEEAGDEGRGRSRSCGGGAFALYGVVRK